MREPLRSQLFVIAGVALGAIGAALITARLTALVWVWYGLLFTALAGLLFAHSYFRRRRPARLPSGTRGHVIHPVIPPGAGGAIALMFIGTWLAPFGRAYPVGEVLFWAVIGIPVLIILTWGLLTWRETYLALTPEGLVWRAPYARRTIPWDALAPGGPAQPSIRDTWLPLAVARPELVTQRGLAFVAGSKARPRVPLDIRVHPWLLADAIRWYAEHPEHRAAIGTHTEHDRLLTAVNAPHMLHRSTS